MIARPGWTAIVAGLLAVAGQAVAGAPHPFVEVTRQDLQGVSLQVTVASSISDTQEPGPGVVFHYLVRPSEPESGTWGQDSNAVERLVPRADLP